MSFLTGTANTIHTAKLPRDTPRAIVVTMLHDHEFFLSCNPVLAKFELVPSPPSPPVLPAAVVAKRRSPETQTITYTVTDVLHALPAGIWDANVVSTYEFTDLTDGVFVRIKAPLGVVMDTLWEVRESQKDGDQPGLELVDDSTITCNRMLLGIMKSECEGGYHKMMPKILERLEGDVKKAVVAAAGKGEVA